MLSEGHMRLLFKGYVLSGTRIIGEEINDLDGLM